MDITKERTQNLVFKYKEQRTKSRIELLVTAIPCPFIYRKRKQNYKEKQTLETYQPTSPLFKEMFTS